MSELNPSAPPVVNFALVHPRRAIRAENARSLTMRALESPSDAQKAGDTRAGGQILLRLLLLLGRVEKSRDTPTPLIHWALTHQEVRNKRADL